MKDSVIIKSTKYGIRLLLNDQVDFETLVREICTKFAESKSFWGSANLIIRLDGRELTADETACIVEAIELNSDVKITLIEENDEIKDIKMKGEIDRFYYDKVYENARIIKGSIKQNAKITSDNSIVILGDVKKNAVVEAKGNIIVIGSLEGEAYAGYPNDKTMFVAATEFLCDNITIGGVVGAPKVHKKWSLRASNKEKEPMGAVVWNNNELLIEPIKSGILKNVK